MRPSRERASWSVVGIVTTRSGAVAVVGTGTGFVARDGPSPADCLIPALNTTCLASSEQCACKAVSMRWIGKVWLGYYSIGTPTLDLPMWVARQLNLTLFDTRSRRRRKRGNFGPAPAQHEPKCSFAIATFRRHFAQSYPVVVGVIAIFMRSPVDIHIRAIECQSSAPPFAVHVTRGPATSLRA